MKIKSSTMDKVFVTCNTIFLVLFVTITLYVLSVPEVPVLADYHTL